MQIIDLLSVLASNNYDKTNMVYLEENECSDASFLVSCFIWEALHVRNAEVVTLMCHNSVQHHQHLISRINHNARNLFSKPKMTNLNIADYIRNDCLNVTELLSNLRKFCEQRAEKNILFVVDDISYVYLLSSLQDCIHFVRYCIKLLSTYRNLRIVIGSHNSSDDDELNIISKFLQHCNKFNLSVTPLKSGFSSEVTGHLTITSKILLESNVNKYYFKLEDKKILINPYVL